jgi:hypothetical protein
MTAKLIEEMSDKELIAFRNSLNEGLPDEFFASSARYDNRATLLSEIERELNRREHEGPPWLAD